MFVKKHFLTKTIFANPDELFIKFLLTYSSWNAMFAARFSYQSAKWINTSTRITGPSWKRCASIAAWESIIPRNSTYTSRGKHELPSHANFGRKTTKPISSAFDGALKVLKIDGSGENDLMQFATDVKPQIDKLVCENVTRTGRTLQIRLRTELSKPTKGEET